jgi:hypothetical protein
MDEHGAGYEQVRVIVETSERTFRGFLYKPILDPAQRVSDYLNDYDRPFLCLSDVSVTDRGQAHRPGEKRPFIAIATNAISFVAPMNDGEV